MSRVRFDVSGLRVFDRKLAALRRAGTNMGSGLRVAGEEIMTDVKASRSGAGVPVDENVLRPSGRVEGPVRNTVELSFGGASAPYALKQHEDVTFRHTVGEARYLVRGAERFSQTDGPTRALEQMADEAISAARVA